MRLTLLLLIVANLAAQGTLVSKDPRFDRLIPPGSQLEKLADGHRWAVGNYPNPWVETSWAASYGGKRDDRAASRTVPMT